MDDIPKKKVGRPKGSINSVSRRAVVAAAATGKLPHEWLLSVARGEPVEHHRLVVHKDADGQEIGREYVKEMCYPDMDARIDAAKAAAPYYAPKLAVQQVNVSKESSENIADVFKQFAEHLPV